jgi:hypothetical protein
VVEVPLEVSGEASLEAFPDELELELPSGKAELVAEDSDALDIVVKLPTDFEVAGRDVAELTVAADLVETVALVATRVPALVAALETAADVAAITEVVVELPVPADTITKSTQLSYVCLAPVPNQNHWSTHSPAVLQSLAARLVGMVTAKLVLFAGSTLRFSSA